MITITIIILLIIYFVHKANVERYEKTSYYQATQKPYFATMGDKGNYGEYLLSNYLQKYANDGAKFLYNCYLPKDNGDTTEVDLIMIHTSGIFVFESKNYSGWIFGTEYQNNWTQTLPGRRHATKEHFFNPVIQNKIHIKWIENLIGESKYIYSFVVFSERCVLKEINITSSNIFVVKRNDLVRCIDDLIARKGIMISQEKVNYLYNQLYPYTTADEYTKNQHIKNIKEREINNIVATNTLNAQLWAGNKDDLRCPNCGGKLVLRTAHRGVYAGNQFYGCSNYPKCKFVKNI